MTFQRLQTKSFDLPGPDRWLSRKLLKILTLFAGGLLVITVAAIALQKYYAVRTRAAAFNRILVALAPSHAITYGTITISPRDNRIIIEDIAVKLSGSSRPVTIGSIVCDDFDTRHPIPHHLSLEAREISVPAIEALGLCGPAMKALGYQSLTGQIACNYAYDNAKNELALNKLVVQVNDLGEISFDGVLSQVREGDLEAMLAPPAAAGYPQWLIRQGRLVYRDDSFIKRFLSYQAKYIGETLPQLRYGMTADLEEAISKEKDDFTRASLKQFAVFLASLKYLQITARPDQPVSYAALQKVYDRDGIQGLIPALKLTFSTHQP